VALKELLRDSPIAEVRFLREAVITSRLEHPNIVPVHEAGRWPDGRPYYAMKLVSGRPLRALIDACRSFAERLALLDRVVAVTDAIAYAHDRGVIHRDLKPSNIIVGDYGETIVIDWGLAKYLGDADEGETVPATPDLSQWDLTHAGTVLGTPTYMAPEQAAGGEVSERSDVYALGAILLNVLGGHAPALGSSGETVTASSGLGSDTDQLAPEARELDAHTPADLRSIVNRAMARDPARRYESARALGEDLRRWMAGRPVLAHEYRLGERVARWLARRRRLVQTGIAVLAALLALTVLFLARESRLRGSA